MSTADLCQRLANLREFFAYQQRQLFKALGRPASAEEWLDVCGQHLDWFGAYHTELALRGYDPNATTQIPPEFLTNIFMTKTLQNRS